MSGPRRARNACAPNAPAATATNMRSAASVSAARAVISSRILRSRPAAAPSGQDSTMTIQRRGVGPRLSHLVIYAPPPSGRFVYLAGQVAADRDADLTAPPRRGRARTEHLLAAPG